MITYDKNLTFPSLFTDHSKIFPRLNGAAGC